MNSAAKMRFWAAIAGLLVVVSLGVFVWQAQRPNRPSAVAVAVTLPPVAAMPEERIEQLCSHCHQRPPPEALPKDAWAETIWMMVGFGGFGSNVQGQVSVESVVQWYEERAPDELTLPKPDFGPGTGSMALHRTTIRSAAGDAVPFISNVQLADVSGDAHLELIACDMSNGLVLIGREGETKWSLEPVGEVSHPAHAEVVDLDGDGLQDLLVSNLGSFLAMDHKLGSVEWLRQTATGDFQRVTLADDLGRVANAKPADLDNDGDLDIVVAEFGWRWTGHLVILENQTASGEPPRFEYLAIDGLHGCSHIAMTDLDGNGLVDVLALFSQEHEQVRCYLNQGQMTFDAQDIYRAEHPAWGYSGFQVIDLDGDADADILMTNGDTYDDSLLKPYHGIQWLENQGDLQFQLQGLVRMSGVYRAEAGDMDGDGDMDIVACALCEAENLPEAQGSQTFESLIWLEQVGPRQFTARSLEQQRAFHPTLTVGDHDRDGDIDVFVGNGRLNDTGATERQMGVDVWENRGVTTKDTK